MSNKAIEISVLRVTSNSSAIEFCFNLPENYDLNEFTIKVENDDNQLYSIYLSLYEEGLSHYVGSVPLSKLGVSSGERKIYEIKISAVDSTEEEAPISASAMISDVGSVYECLVDDIIKLDESGLCNNGSTLDRIIRNYFVLYAHQEAMIHKNFVEAKMFMDMMSNCFNGCSQQKTSGCNCGKS